MGPLLYSLCVERGIQRIAMIAHDPVWAGLPEGAGGVTSQCVYRPVCRPAPRLDWCDCEDEDHGAVRLETTVHGASMATGIQENAFDAAAFVREVQRCVALGMLPSTTTVGLRRPFPNNPQTVHWLLRSLTLVRVQY